MALCTKAEGKADGKWEEKKYFPDVKICMVLPAIVCFVMCIERLFLLYFNVYERHSCVLKGLKGA